MVTRGAAGAHRWSVSSTPHVAVTQSWPIKSSGKPTDDALDDEMDDAVGGTPRSAGGITSKGISPPMPVGLSWRMRPIGEQSATTPGAADGCTVDGMTISVWRCW